MELFFLLFGLVFLVVVGAILFQLTRSVAQWAHNNAQPVLSEPARVVAKRTETSGSVAGNTGGSVSTYYYVTFELESGERREFWVSGSDYGLLVEGDAGTLTFQGTRYHGFDRDSASRHQAG